ncbi:MAG: NAD-dependent epimerase/dehydratase family protein [Nitrososphaeraceae archaeon]
MAHKKVVVTGGAGFLGSYLVDLLLRRGYEVTVFDNGFRTGFDNIEHIKDATLIRGDVTKNEDWENIPKDIDLAFHLAAINGTKYFYEIPEKVIEVNTKGTLNFMSWIKDTNTSRLFFASSSEVYGFPKIFPTPETEPLVVPDPKNPRFSYSSSKIIGETIVINYAKSLGIDFSIGRFHNVYGPKMGFEHVMPEFIRRCVKNEQFVVQGNGMESRSFCYVSDAIDGILLLTESSSAKNEIFNIGTNEEITIKGLISQLEKIHGKTITPIFKEFHNAGTSRRNPDISKISKLGYKPKVPLAVGLKKTYDWYTNFYKSKK